MKVNIAVCGKFHYHNYVKFIYQAGLLNRFYYSHKISTNSKVLLTEDAKLVNLWIKEYLLRGYLKLFSHRGWNFIYPLLGDVWQQLALRRFKPADILHVMLDGMSLKLITQTKKDGNIVIGEAITSHPFHRTQILNEEYEKFGLRKMKIPRHHLQFINEVELSDHLIVASEYVKKTFIERGVDENRIVTLSYGINLVNFYPITNLELNRLHEKFRVICVGQISFGKGQIYLLEAWKQLNLINSELLLIGTIDSKIKPFLKKYEGLYKHLESIPNAQLRNLYVTGSVFVMPSLDDGYGLVVGEAMACGLPVIVTTNTGASDLIEHGKEGFIVPIRSPEAIAEYLKKLFLDPDLRYAISQAALAKAQTISNWKHYSEKLISFYNSVIL